MLDIFVTGFFFSFLNFICCDSWIYSLHNSQYMIIDNIGKQILLDLSISR